MSDRTNLTIDSAVHDRLAQAKGSTDTWDEFLSRLLNASEQGQVHLDRATLADFDDEGNVLRVRASEGGTLRIEVRANDGEQLGETTLSTLAGGQEAELELVEGDVIDE
jgi:hypothetical protein